MVDKITDYKLKIISLYKSDYIEEYHVREMAKLIGTSHVTLLPHLKDLEEEKILISEKKGRNKVYTLNFDNILAKEYLIMAEKYHSLCYLEGNFLIKKITQELQKLNLNSLILLFGSYAKGTETKVSDIDLFILEKPGQKTKEDIKNIGIIYGKEINIKSVSYKNFNKTLKNKDTLILEIIKNHITLQNSEIFINYLWKYYDEKRK